MLFLADINLYEHFLHILLTGSSLLSPQNFSPQHTQYFSQYCSSIIFPFQFANGEFYRNFIINETITASSIAKLEDNATQNSNRPM